MGCGSFASSGLSAWTLAQFGVPMSAAKAPGPLPPGLMASSLQRDAPEKSRDSAGFAGLSGSWTNRVCVQFLLKPRRFFLFLPFSLFPAAGHSAFTFRSGFSVA